LSVALSREREPRFKQSLHLPSLSLLTLSKHSLLYPQTISRRESQESIMAHTYTVFDEERFRAQVDKALRTVVTILDTNRNPRYAEEQDHVYEDKYALADFMTNTAIVSYINVLERFGLDESKLRQLCQVVHQDKRSVTLRFAMEDSCSFLEEKT
jgi:hypothetical protein